MAKTKFILTPDLIKVEPEPQPLQAPSSSLQAVREAEREASQPSHDVVEPAYIKPPVQQNNVPVQNNAPVQVKSPSPQLQAIPSAQPMMAAPQTHPQNPTYPTQHPVHMPPQPQASQPQVPQPNYGYGEPLPMMHSGGGEGTYPNHYTNPYHNPRDMVIRDQFNLKIDKALKMEFRIWCLRNDISMTEALEDALREFMQKGRG